MRSFLDANLWIPATLFDGFMRKLVRAAIATGKVVTSPELVEEVSRKLRDRFGVFSLAIDSVQRTMTDRCWCFSNAVTLRQLCRDPKDELFLAQAVESQCAYLVSQDKDLLVLDPVESLRIIPPHEFSAILGVK